ncbi:unnamed protein product [Ambrosiozyma monospora]|uniref:Unnamed protein product n=1 Tax=Ambrosiozyma monospora TaxID=43982 RepID=A0A9W6T309_AMBMO|nr:unnamed protein product [Ambrosiozyma monospora]
MTGSFTQNSLHSIPLSFSNTNGEANSGRSILGGANCSFSGSNGITLPRPQLSSVVGTPGGNYGPFSSGSLSSAGSPPFIGKGHGNGNVMFSIGQRKDTTSPLPPISESLFSQLPHHQHPQQQQPDQQQQQSQRQQSQQTYPHYQKGASPSSHSSASLPPMLPTPFAQVPNQQQQSQGFPPIGQYGTSLQRQDSSPSNYGGNGGTSARSSGAPSPWSSTNFEQYQYSRSNSIPPVASNNTNQLPLPSTIPPILSPGSGSGSRSTSASASSLPTVPSSTTVPGAPSLISPSLPLSSTFLGSAASRRNSQYSSLPQTHPNKNHNNQQYYQ